MPLPMWLKPQEKQNKNEIQVPVLRFQTEILQYRIYIARLKGRTLLKS